MKIKSIRSFVGAKNFDESRAFYKELGFAEVPLSAKMSYFGKGEFGFYLQNYYAKDWVDNTMLFLEVDDLETILQSIRTKNLTEKYTGVKLSDIHKNDWGSEFFLHDPGGILWHIGNFKD